MTDRRAGVVCLGEAVVDFVSASPVDRVTDAPSFVPSRGGSQANIAVGAARFGAPTALVGCAGIDPWGQWLRAGIESEGVDVAMYELRDDVVTTLAFVALSADGEPTFSIYDGAAAGFLAGRREKLHAFLDPGPAGVLAFGSDSLIVPGDREVLADLKQAAAQRGWRVLYDPNLRDDRWADPDVMLKVAREALTHVSVVKANAPEAAALTGEADPGAAAAALVRLGPPQALVTRGEEGAVLASNDGIVEIPAELADVVDTTGAGDAVAAVLAAGLCLREEVTVALGRAAMRVAARVVGVRGALAGLPPRAEARMLLDV